ncbi:MAG TPA: VWA domain-containing protein [Chloroflexia bacterium]|nr:VWA domain-containing protein [Chloroflexia bacterium]
MASEIALSCALNVTSVPAAGEPRLLYLLINVTPGEGASAAQAPVNMAIVLDVSESMRLPVLSQEQFYTLSQMGQAKQIMSDGVPVWTFDSIPPDIRKAAPSNLEAIQGAISAASEHFEARDRLTLVAFADSSEVVLSGVPGSDRQRVLDAVAALDNIQLGDETDIALGLQAGIEEIKRSGSEGMVKRALVLTDGFTREPEAVRSLARSARAAGIAVSTLGIGSEFNEKLLLEVADASHGNAYFARLPREIPPAFARELEAVQAIALHGVDVNLRFSAGVELRRTYRVRPSISLVSDARRDERTVEISVGDLHATEPTALLLEVVVPPQPTGVFSIARVWASHLVGNERVSGKADNVVLNYSASREKAVLNPNVMNTVERVSAFVLQTRALDDAALGNTAAATQKLRAAATRLLAAGEADLANALESEATQIEESGEVSPDGAKELRYATRKLTQKL